MSEIEVLRKLPKQRHELLKWNGWGYNDCGFLYEDGDLVFKGDRYPLGSSPRLPHFTAWVASKLGANFSRPHSPLPPPSAYPPPTPPPASFLEAISGMASSTAGPDRLFRSHGHTLAEIYKLRTGTWSRIPDLVVWPGGHADVVKIVEGAGEGMVLVPFGGGTSVTGGLTVDAIRTNVCICVVDMSQMNRILSLDTSNLTCTAEAGIIGQDLESSLRSHGYTTGHEPDSYEFSSLGGWVSTRASGMKKNTYGNIEDLLVGVVMVSGVGVVGRPGPSQPRVSIGPDLHQVVIGSEGTLGIVTQATLKIRPVPPVQKYGSIVFPNFEAGVRFMREVARQRCQPSSVRLMDNEQFQFGHSLRAGNNWLGSIKEILKKLYLKKIKGFELEKIVVTTLLFEGTSASVEAQEAKLYAVARTEGGLVAGASSGERGYVLTFVIAYIRDIALDFGIVAESFETSVEWTGVSRLCENVKQTVRRECQAHGLTHIFITCRVTQTYDSGACVYFYFAFNYEGIDDPVQVFEEIEDAAREEILACGGSLSHHHGVGQVRRKWLGRSIGGAGLRALHYIKSGLDPKGIFGAGNLLGRSGDHQQAKL